MTIEIPADVRNIINTLEGNGYDAYVVGGCVRDCVMGLKPKDWDICTSALPGQIKHIFGNVIETGIKHGTVTLVRSGQPFEITTYRTDGVYTDKRHPDSVTFVSDLKEDLSRRDFTCNALAYSSRTGIVDLSGGIEDIDNKVLRCVGDADLRFREDALRIMRALRFASKFGFEIERVTSDSLQKNKDLLRSIAPERIAAELNMMLTGCDVSNILIKYADVLAVIIPEIELMFGFEQNNPHHYLDVWEHTVMAVSNAPQDKTLRLVMLLHDIAKPICYSEADGRGHFHGHPQAGSEMSKKVLKRLKYDNDTISKVFRLVFYHDTEIIPSHKNTLRWLSRIGEESLRQLVEVKRADIKAQSEQHRADRLAALDKVLIIIDEIVEQQLCFSLKDLAVNGRDLLAAGVPEGNLIGKTLNQLLEMVVDNRVENEREILLHAAKDLYETL